jgi:hypothetical protein
MHWTNRPINWFIAAEAIGVLATLTLHLAAWVCSQRELHRAANLVLGLTAAVAFLPLVAAGLHAGVRRFTKKPGE